MGGRVSVREMNTRASSNLLLMDSADLFQWTDDVFSHPDAHIYTGREIQHKTFTCHVSDAITYQTFQSYVAGETSNNATINDMIFDAPSHKPRALTWYVLMFDGVATANSYLLEIGAKWWHRYPSDNPMSTMQKPIPVSSNSAIHFMAAPGSRTPGAYTATG
jgi:hypothetical protein